ncbi:hypothetical protein MHBO_000587 [Bonamia ostreae]|uniref:Uncharacterized protein n=1 Tax=Bonamia ostreae TaxID=126728 RepID=A0ABV2AG36_9EUKA
MLFLIYLLFGTVILENCTLWNVDNFVFENYDKNLKNYGFKSGIYKDGEDRRGKMVVSCKKGSEFVSIGKKFLNEYFIGEFVNNGFKIVEQKHVNVKEICCREVSEKHTCSLEYNGYANIGIPAPKFLNHGKCQTFKDSRNSTNEKYFCCIENVLRESICEKSKVFVKTLKNESRIESDLMRIGDICKTTKITEYWDDILKIEVNFIKIERFNVCPYSNNDQFYLNTLHRNNNVYSVLSSDMLLVNIKIGRFPSNLFYLKNDDICKFKCSLLQCEKDNKTIELNKISNQNINCSKKSGKLSENFACQNKSCMINEYLFNYQEVETGKMSLLNCKRNFIGVRAKSKWSFFPKINVTCNNDLIKMVSELGETIVDEIDCFDLSDYERCPSDRINKDLPDFVSCKTTKKFKRIYSLCSHLSPVLYFRKCRDVLEYGCNMHEDNFNEFYCQNDQKIKISCGYKKTISKESYHKKLCDSKCDMSKEFSDSLQIDEKIGCKDGELVKGISGRYYFGIELICQNTKWNIHVDNKKVDILADEHCSKFKLKSCNSFRFFDKSFRYEIYCGNETLYVECYVTKTFGYGPLEKLLDKICKLSLNFCTINHHYHNNTVSKQYLIFKKSTKIQKYREDVFIASNNKLKINLECHTGTFVLPHGTNITKNSDIAKLCESMCLFKTSEQLNIDFIESGSTETVRCLDKKFVKIEEKYFDSVALLCHERSLINKFMHTYLPTIGCERVDVATCRHFSKDSISDYHYNCSNDNGKIIKLNFFCEDKLYEKIRNVEWKRKVLVACRSCNILNGKFVLKGRAGSTKKYVKEGTHDVECKNSMKDWLAKEEFLYPNLTIKCSNSHLAHHNFFCERVDTGCNISKVISGGQIISSGPKDGTILRNRIGIFVVCPNKRKLHILCKRSKIFYKLAERIQIYKSYEEKTKICDFNSGDKRPDNVKIPSLYLVLPIYSCLLLLVIATSAFACYKNRD